jgi:hypothetical protein
LEGKFHFGASLILEGLSIRPSASNPVADADLPLLRRFLNSNFWTNYRAQSSQSIEEALNKKDCSVENLLDDDDLIQEFKNHNEKLINL